MDGNLITAIIGFFLGAGFVGFIVYKVVKAMPQPVIHNNPIAHAQANSGSSGHAAAAPHEKSPLPSLLIGGVALLICAAVISAALRDQSVNVPSALPASAPAQKPAPIPTAILTAIPTMIPTMIPTAIPKIAPSVPVEVPAPVPIPTAQPIMLEALLPLIFLAEVAIIGGSLIVTAYLVSEYRKQKARMSPIAPQNNIQSAAAYTPESAPVEALDNPLLQYMAEVDRRSR
jgi:hypothetical protein